MEECFSTPHWLPMSCCQPMKPPNYPGFWEQLLSSDRISVELWSLDSEVSIIMSSDNSEILFRPWDTHTHEVDTKPISSPTSTPSTKILNNNRKIKSEPSDSPVSSKEYSLVPSPDNHQLQSLSIAMRGLVPGTWQDTRLNSHVSHMMQIRAANHLHEMQVAANKLQDFQLAVASVSDKKIRPKKYKCDQCNACFSNNGQLRGHVRIHTGMV